MQPHIDQRADEIVQERAALTDLLAELASVQDSHGWHATRQGLRRDVRQALQGHFSTDENLAAALALLWRVRVDWEGVFTLDVDTLADIRAFLKNVEG